MKQVNNINSAATNEKVAKFIKGSKIVVDRVAKLAIAIFLAIAILTFLDRYFSSAAVIEQISNMSNANLQAGLIAFSNWIGRTVDAIGATARTIIPWNHQDPALFGSQVYKYFH